MRKGVYLVIIVKSIDRNGIGIEPITCQVAECDYREFKKSIEKEEWKVYCRSTLSSNLNQKELIKLPKQEITEIQI